MRILHMLFVFSFFSIFLLFGSNQKLNLIINNKKCNEWKKKQINKDLESFKERKISKRELDEVFKEKSKYLFLVKFSIINNKLDVSYLFETDEGLLYRLNCYIKALTTLCNTVTMPDVTLLLSMLDFLENEEKVPIFVMSKDKNLRDLILIPDFDAICGRYQVLKFHAVTRCVYQWQKKHPQMIWRGSTAQISLDRQTGYLIPDNLHLFSRVTLCEYSREFPSLIDAKFTFFAQGAEHIPCLQKYRGKYVSFEKQIEYKYHILIDGNASAYSASGWKYFINSLVFKPDSQMTQWYYDALIPYVHYVPVKANLDDLIEKIHWAMTHDDEAELIASNAWNFAVNSITVEHNLAYIYYLLLGYSQLHFVP